MRLALFALVFVFNALMWTLFTKSLCGCSSSVEATVTNTASNFFFTVSFEKLFIQIFYFLCSWGDDYVVHNIIDATQGELANRRIVSHLEAILYIPTVVIIDNVTSKNCYSKLVVVHESWWCTH